MITDKLLKQAIAETRNHGQASCVTTRDGRAVRVYACDHMTSYPVTGATMAECGWFGVDWQINGLRRGRRHDQCTDDLIPARRSGEETLYVYEMSGRICPSADGTLQHLGWRLIARIPVKWTEGDGL